VAVAVAVAMVVALVFALLDHSVTFVHITVF